MAKPTPWAVLLCKWKDQAAEPPRSFFENLFTPAGAGTRNMVEFFDLMSHGSVDVSGSQVFGWLTLPKDQSAYFPQKSPLDDGEIDRGGLVELAKATAAVPKSEGGLEVDVSAFYGVVVCMNVATDLFGGLYFAVCDPGSFRPAVLGQEMGHGYGLDHSRRDGLLEDYRDRWDVMSTWSDCYIAADADYTEIGPGLNAANMRSVGWLDWSRVWRSAGRGFSEQLIELRPLHRRDLPGFLAVEMPNGYVIEFRTKAGWDAAIPRPAILMHYFKDGQSYLLANKGGVRDLAASDVFEKGDPSNTSPMPFTRVEVVSIDAGEQRATIRVSYRPIVSPEPANIFVWPPELPSRPGPVERLIQEIARQITLDRSDFDDSAVTLPALEPTFRILEQVSAYLAASRVTDMRLRDSVQREALSQIVGHAQSALETRHHFESPAPRVHERHGDDTSASQT